MMTKKGFAKVAVINTQNCHKRTQNCSHCRLFNFFIKKRCIFVPIKSNLR